MRSFSATRFIAAALTLTTSTICLPLAGYGSPAGPSSTSSTAAASKPAKPVKVAVSASAPTVSITQAAPNPYGLNPQEAQFVDLVNHERTTRGIGSLTVDPVLVQIARDHSEEMCKLNYFDHHSPTPGITTPMDRYLKALKDSNTPMPGYVLVGENIYYCSVMDDHYNVDYGHQSLMNSPGHRANILDPRFLKIGVGTYRDAKGEFWVTETFLCDSDPDAVSTTAGSTSPQATN